MPLTAHIDLGTGEIKIHETDPELLHQFLGGRGLGARMLFDMVGPSVDAFDPGNALIFTTGLFDGTSWPASARYHVTFKSPATGAYGYANGGGHFGPELRWCGFDAVAITGRSPRPVVLQVVGDTMAIVPADHLWGRTTSQVERALLEHGGGRVASIGPAGENLVRFAAIINDGGRAAARSGPGAVMGSKNLKALHVRATERRAKTSSAFAKVAGAKSRHVARHPNVKGLSELTTVFLMGIQSYFGVLPARNHQVAGAPFIESVDVGAIRQYWIEHKGCHACPIRCARMSRVGEGAEEVTIEGPEYETSDALGPMVWNADPEVIIRANALCNEYGLDTISAGVTIAFAMECHERGLLDDGQFSLEWGDAATILGLIEAIAKRDGIGDLLAEGTKRAALEIDGDALSSAMQVKGVEMPRQEPRKAKGFGLGHATSNRGADHLYALPTIDLARNWEAARKIFPGQIVDQLMDTADETYKPDLVFYTEHYCAVADSLGICKFTTPETYALMVDDLAEGLRAMGWEVSGADLLTIGERIVNLERMYNVRHGFSRKDDVLPPRFTQQTLPVYPYSVNQLTGKKEPEKDPVDSGAILKLQPMLDRYYQLRGWDENGIPTRKTLKRLGLLLMVS